MRRRVLSRPMALIVAFAVTGCATTAPYVGKGPHPQIERGNPNVVIDTIGNITGLIGKLLMWDRRFASHSLSADTESYVVVSLESYPETTDQTKVRLNQYAPIDDLKRLTKNDKVSWIYRLFLGLPATVFTEVLFPGRIMPWGDYYNAWTDTVHLYSDHPAIALHEVGHVDDIMGRKYKGSYAFIRLVPLVDLYQEHQATDRALTHLVETGEREQEIAAYKILYPAMGTYVGGYIPFVGLPIGVIGGHVLGRNKAKERERHYGISTP